MAMNDKLRSLVSLLTQATKEGAIEWDANTDLGTFRANLDQGHVQLSVHPSGDGYNLLVYNDRDIIVQQTGYLSERADPSLAELARVLRARLLNADEVVETMISSLRKKVHQS